MTTSLPQLYSRALALFATILLPASDCGIILAQMPVQNATQSRPSQNNKETVLPEVVVSGTKAHEAKQTSSISEGSIANGYRSVSASIGPLGQLNIQDAPYSISVTPSALIEDIQSSTPTDALKLNPMVNPEMGSNRTGDYLSIRGFINSDNQALDGMRQDMSNGAFLENKERIEVLSGADSFLYGIASPAGMVNYILKRPTAERILTVTFGDYGGAQAYTHIDAGGPIGSATHLGYRINLLGVNAGSTGINDETHKRMLYSGAFDWHITTNTLWAFDGSYYHRDLEYLQSFFKLGSATVVPKAPDASRNYAAPYAGMENTNATYGTNLNSKISDVASFRAAFRYNKSLADARSLRVVWTGNAGDYTHEMLYYPGQNKDETFQGQFFLDALFHTGFVEHKISIGYILDHISDTSTSAQGTQFYEGTTIFNMSHPGYEPFPNVTITKDGPYVPVETRTRQSEIIADQMLLHHGWSAIAGGTYAGIRDVNYPPSTGNSISRYDKGQFTPALALLYKPTSSVTTYISYIEALAEGPIAPDSAKNASQILPPYVSNQLEAGLKATIRKMNVTTAFFRINEENAYTDSATNIYSEDGREVHTGGEMSFAGKPGKDLTLLGGFSILHASIDKTSNASLRGKSPQAVPKAMARLYADYAILAIRGLSLTGGIYYTGSEWVNNINTISIPKIIPLDLGIRYQRKLLRGTTTFRLNTNNLTNENYWTTKGGSMLYLGSPRTVATSLTMLF